MNLRVKGQTPRESGFARARTAQPPATRSDHSTGVCRETALERNDVACEEVREEESAGTRGYGGPQEWVLTATLANSARGPGTHRREIEGRECDHI